MKYVNYDKKTNEILGYYDDAIHENIPTPSVEISEEQWAKALDMGCLLYTSPSPRDTR